MRYFEKSITEHEAGDMVKSLLTPLHIGRKLRRLLVEQRLIRINGQPVYLSNRVKAGDVLTIDAPVEMKSSTVPQNLPLMVRFEDEHILVVDKPAGMVAHATSKYESGTLTAAIANHMVNRQEAYVIRLVHRLDRQTSGLLLVAKHKLAHERLVRSLKLREVNRNYIAFVHGLVLQDALIIDEPIDTIKGQIKRVVGPAGKEAKTLVWVKKTYATAGASKVWVSLLTGRTHQIRVHLAHAGYPLIGDTLYSATGQAWSTQGRQALHAAELRFSHPITHENLLIQSPLPDDLLDLEAQLLNGQIPGNE